MKTDFGQILATTVGVFDDLARRSQSEHKLLPLAKNKAILSRWRHQDMVGFMRKDGVGLVSGIVDELSNNHPMLAAKFLSSYISFILEWGEEGHFRDSLRTISMEIRSDNDTHYENLKTVKDWVRYAIALHFLNRLHEEKIVFSNGWKAWKHFREGFDVNKVAFYAVRRALFLAKTQLITRNQLDSQISTLGEQILLEGEPPKFSDYEVETEEVRTYRPELGGFMPLNIDGVPKDKLFRSVEVDMLLRSNAADDLLLVVDDGQYKLNPDCHHFAWLALRHSLSRIEADIFNGIKVRFSTPLTASTFSSGSITIQQTSYLANQVTNYSTGLRFRHKTFGAVIELKTEDGSLLPSSEMSRQVGVAALLITLDGYLVAMYQNHINNRSGGSLVPLSGSVEFYDYDFDSVPKQELTLGELLKKGLKREVCEEACLEEASIIDILLLGHTLDSANGLNPDFFGAAFTKQVLEDIRNNREEMFGGPFEFFKLDLSSSQTFRDSVVEANSQWRDKKTHMFLHAGLFYIAEAADLVVDCYNKHVNIGRR